MPSEDSILLQEAVSAAKRGDRGAAQSLLHRASEAQPDNELVWLWRSHLAESAAERISFLREARVRCLEPRQAEDELAKALFSLGIEEGKAGRWAGAQEALEEALELDPRNVDGWLWLASVLKDRGAQKRCLEKVLAVDPTHSHARALLSRPEFREELQPARQRCPICDAERVAGADRCSGCGALLSLADLHAMIANPEVNEEVVERAIRAREGLVSWSDGVEHHHVLALAYLNLGRVDRGIHHLQIVSSRRPSDRILKSQVEILELLQQREKRALESETQPLDTLTDPEAAPPAEESPKRREAAPVLLVIDDSATVRKLVASSLEPHGYRVVGASDGLEGLSRLREQKMEMVLLDINLPGMDGYQVCKIIKSDEATSRVPVVMLSGRAGLFDRMRGRKVGSSGHLSKPFEPKALLGLVRKNCGAVPGQPAD